MKKSLIIILGSLTIAFLFLSFKPAYAAVGLDSDLYPKGAATVDIGTPEDMATSVTARIINVLFGLAGVVAIFFIVQNGFFLAMSGGSEETVTQHKKGIMWAIIGLILVILSYSIVRFVISIPMGADEKFNPTTPAAPASDTDSSAPAAETPAYTPPPTPSEWGASGRAGNVPMAD